MNEQESLFRETSEHSGASFASGWKPLDSSVSVFVCVLAVLGEREREFRTHVWEEDSCCSQHLFSGTTCFSRERRPTEERRQPSGITPGDVCQPYVQPAAGTGAVKGGGGGRGGDSSVGPRHRERQCHVRLTAQLTPGRGQTQAEQRRTSRQPSAERSLMSNISYV